MHVVDSRCPQAIATSHSIKRAQKPSMGTKKERPHAAPLPFYLKINSLSISSSLIDILSLNC